MGRFDHQVQAVQSWLRDQRAAGRLRELDAKSGAGWPEESSLVLEEDTAVELGHPLAGSLAFIVWSQLDGLVRDGVDLVGPDLNELTVRRAPLGQVVMVGGEFGEEYDGYRALKNAVHGVKLQGVMARAMPSQQTFWYRVNRPALNRGLSLAHLGASLIASLKAIDFVHSARLLFVTSSKADLESLRDPARETGRIAGAMNKMYEEMNYDCDACEYSDVCDEVGELKKIRERFSREAKG